MNEYNHRFHWFLSLLLAALIALCGIMVITEAKAEDSQIEPAPSITVEALYRIVSGTIEKADRPFELQVIDCMRIDIDQDKIPDQVAVIDAELFFPALPTTVKSIFLFDGYRAIPADWHWTDQNAVYVSFQLSDILSLKETHGLYLFLLTW